MLTTVLGLIFLEKKVLDLRIFVALEQFVGAGAGDRDKESYQRPDAEAKQWSLVGDNYRSPDGAEQHADPVSEARICLQIHLSARMAPCLFCFYRVYRRIQDRSAQRILSHHHDNQSCVQVRHEANDHLRDYRVQPKYDENS